MRKNDLQLSIVVPVYNEALGLPAFHASLLIQAEKIAPNAYEIVYCDDGSTDATAALIRTWYDANSRIKLVTFSRNFGKENALAAGIAEARGQAIVTLDGDGQHPVELLPQFFAAWRAGAQVVVGLRTDNTQEGWLKRWGSRSFYKLFNAFTGQRLQAGASDFRLIDRAVQQAFLQLKETDRMTRGLIDWLGFRREYIPFVARARAHGTAGYSTSKLFKLAANSFISLSPKPLYLFGYLGVMITFGALLLGLAVLLEQVLLGDPWSWEFTGTAMLGILILFLVGIVLLSQGILSLYISHIHSQSKHRPLYIIDYQASAGVTQKELSGHED